MPLGGVGDLKGEPFGEDVDIESGLGDVDPHGVVYGVVQEHGEVPTLRMRARPWLAAGTAQAAVRARSTRPATIRLLPGLGGPWWHGSVAGRRRGGDFAPLSLHPGGRLHVAGSPARIQHTRWPKGRMRVLGSQGQRPRAGGRSAAEAPHPPLGAPSPGGGGKWNQELQGGHRDLRRPATARRGRRGTPPGPATRRRGGPGGTTGRSGRGSRCRRWRRLGGLAEDRVGVEDQLDAPVQAEGGGLLPHDRAEPAAVGDGAVEIPGAGGAPSAARAKPSRARAGRVSSTRR